VAAENGGRILADTVTTNEVAVHFTTEVMAFFAIMNPIANSSVFMGLTGEMDGKLQRKIALRSVLVAFGITAFFAIGGREIFSLFGITLPAFRVAGGVLVALIGFHMLQGNHSSIHKSSDEDNEASKESVVDIAITPLGIPLLAGPGTIATAMNFTAQSSFVEIVRVLAAFGLICVLTFLAFLSGQWFERTIGQNAIKVVSRLMGLILAVIGVQMLLDGIRGWWG